MTEPHPLRVQRHGQRGKIPAGAKLVTRGSRWGNPFEVEQYGRERAIELFEEWLPTRPDLLEQIPDLRGKQLACYCPLDEPCHADVLARLANPDDTA